MKNKALPAITLLAVALAFASPALASANNGQNGNSDSHKNSKSEVKSNNSNRSEKNDRDDDRNDNKNNNNGNKGPFTFSTTSKSGVTITISGNNLPNGLEKRLENGKGLPNGWFKFFGGFFNKFKKDKATTTASTTVDIVAPKISAVSAVAGTSTADLLWKTNEIASSELRFSASSDVNASSSSIIDGSLLFNHSAHIVGLTPNTKYYYVIIAKDALGNVSTKEVRSFKTLAVTPVPVPPVPGTDVTPPTIQFNTVFNITGSSAKLFWITNELADSKAWVSTSTPVSTSGTSTASSLSLVNYHNLDLNSLATSTTYYYLVSSSDSAGNTSTTTGSFVTSS